MKGALAPASPRLEERVRMRRLLAVLPLFLAAGCAGYAADYWRPRTSLMAEQLSRYGLNETQARCVNESMSRSLSVWQLRQLERIARLVPANQFGNRPLSMGDLVAVAANVRDPEVRTQTAAAAESCRVPLGAGAAAAARATEEQRSASAAPSTGPGSPAGPASALGSRGGMWLNLGAAPSGQSIAVNASSIEETGTTRQAWFRLTDPGASAPSDRSYLLRIDCEARTLNSMALRRHGPGGEVVDETDFRPNGEGANPIVGGTVMEIAYLALCT